MTLYEIDERITAALSKAIDPETGELIDEQALEALDGLQMERTQKCENIACYYKSLKAEADAIKAEEKALKHRREVAEHKAERMKDYLDYALQGEKLSTAKVAVSYRKSKSVSIDDMDRIPEIYIREKVSREPDKKQIAEAIKAGDEIPGAHMEETNNIQIR
jgi:hypothetical protein